MSFLGLLLGCGTPSPGPVAAADDTGAGIERVPPPTDTGPLGEEETDDLGWLFDATEIPVFSLTFDADAVASLRADPRAWVSADLDVPAGTLPGVGVHLKGGEYGSFEAFDEKPAFKVEFDQFTPGQRLDGLERLALNNLASDVSGVNQYLAYRAFRALGYPAPRCGYVWLVVNGVDYGLYAAVEVIDEHFVDRWFWNARGNLYEGEYGADFDAAHVDDFTQEAGPTQDRADLAAAADAIAADGSVLDNVASTFQMDRFFTYWSMELLTADDDGYVLAANNYYVYADPDHGFVFVPWGLDDTWRYQMQVYQAFSALPVRCLRDEACKSAYAARLVDLAARVPWEALADELDRVATLIAPARAAETRQTRYTLADTEAAQAELRTYLAERPAEIAAEAR